MSPPTDATWTNALELRVNNAAKFAINKNGELTAGTVPAGRVDKLVSSTNYTYFLGSATSGTLADNTGLIADNGNNNTGGVVNGNYVWRFDGSGTLLAGTVPYARLEDPTVLAASGTNLNNYTAVGVWHQPGNGGATAGTNYPEPLAGLLEVFASGSMVYQRYTTYAMNTSSDSRNARVWTRGRYNGSWSTWQPISKQGHAAGRVGIQITKANTTVSAYASFPTGRFNAAPPAVTATCHSGSANGRMVTISDPSTSGVTIYLWANGVITNSVSWIAQEWG